MEIRQLKALYPPEKIKALALRRREPARDFRRAVRGKGRLSVIAEVKPKSPNEGKLMTAPVRSIARIYSKSTADAISVLTEKKFFGGDLRNIGIVKKLCRQPVLRKDFILDEYQIYESRAAGADAVLLIAAILTSARLKSFLTIAARLGLACVVEIHTRPDLKKALEAGADIIGINNRDLQTMQVDLNTTATLIKAIPRGTIIISESGIRSAADARRLKRLGVNAVLVGTSILKSTEPKSFINRLKL